MSTAKPTDPTPQEIAERALEVQATWDSHKKWSRAGKPKQTWTAPVAQLGELAACAEEFVSDNLEDVLR